MAWQRRNLSKLSHLASLSLLMVTSWGTSQVFSISPDDLENLSFQLSEITHFPPPQLFFFLTCVDDFQTGEVLNANYVTLDFPGTERQEANMEQLQTCIYSVIQDWKLNWIFWNVFQIYFNQCCTVIPSFLLSYCVVSHVNIFFCCLKMVPEVTELTQMCYGRSGLIRKSYYNPGFTLV